MILSQSWSDTMLEVKTEESGNTIFTVYYPASKKDVKTFLESHKEEKETQTIENHSKLTIKSMEQFQADGSTTIPLKGDIDKVKTSVDKRIPVRADLYSVISSVLEDEFFETGIVNDSEKIFMNEFRVDKLGALNTLSCLFMDNIAAESGRKINNLIGTLHIVSHIDYEKVYPMGQMLAMCALNHINKEVSEYGIKCFENWGEKDGISKLSSIRYASKWLQEYADEVIEELKNGG